MSVLLFSISLFCTNFPLNIVEVRAKGTVALAEDMLLVKQEALQMARRNAVEQIVVEILSDANFTKHVDAIETGLLENTSEFVKQAEILLARTRQDRYEVTAKVLVDRARVEKKLSEMGLLSAADMPRIAVLMLDKNSEPVAPGGVVQASLAACFLERGFVVVDLDQAKRNLKREELDALLSLDEEKAAALGLRLNVDLVITGSSQTQDAGDSPLQGFKVASCVVQSRIYFSDNGRLVASENINLNGTGVSPLQASAKALESASEKLCENLTGKVDSFWHKRNSGPRTYTLVMSGASYSESRQIRTYLQKLKGTHSVVEREFNATQVVFDVSLSGRTIEELLDALLSNRCPVKGWALRLKSENTLNLTRKY